METLPQPGRRTGPSGWGHDGIPAGIRDPDLREGRNWEARERLPPRKDRDANDPFAATQCLSARITTNLED